MKAVRGLLPWVTVVVAIGAVTWWLPSRDMAAGRWLLAALLIGHGLVHLLFAVPAPPPTDGGPVWPFDMTRSWAVTRAHLDLRAVRAVGFALIASVVVAFVLGGLAAAGVVVPPAVWPAVIVIAAVASAAVLLLFFEPQLMVGIGIDAVLLWVSVARAWVA